MRITRTVKEIKYAKYAGRQPTKLKKKKKLFDKTQNAKELTIFFGFSKTAQMRVLPLKFLRKVGNNIRFEMPKNVY